MSSQKSMRVPIGSTQVQRHFGEVVRRVYSGQEHFVVEKDGLPVMAIISMQEYQDFMTEREQREHYKQERLRRFEKAARAIGEEIERSGLTEEEALEQLEETREELYRKHYGDNQ